MAIEGVRMSVDTYNLLLGAATKVCTKPAGIKTKKQKNGWTMCSTVRRLIELADAQAGRCAEAVERYDSGEGGAGQRDIRHHAAVLQGTFLLLPPPLRLIRTIVYRDSSCILNVAFGLISCRSYWEIQQRCSSCTMRWSRS